MLQQQSSAAQRNEINFQDLKIKLAAALPKGIQISLYHISTPPTRCSAIYAPASGSKPERTYCESQFLTVAVRPSYGATVQSTPEDGEETRPGLLVYAIEVLIYTTTSLTTLFVSKADSTGYLHLVKQPLRFPSLLKVISTTFLSHLVEARQRLGVKLVVSLFARAQDQYLFPGSVENSGKHVLDDRGLVRWWCKVLDPVLRATPARPEDRASSSSEERNDGVRAAKGYLIVPGFDKYETAPLLPSSVKADPPDDRRWVNGHPLLQLSSTSDAPPRCLIPHFPDDPKARYLDELDDEMTESCDAQIKGTDASYKGLGQWKSVRSLDQFWEMMAFRQECSAGRIVGFIWVVFDPVQRPITGNEDAKTTSQLPQARSIDKDVTGDIVPRPYQTSNQDLFYALRKTDSPHTGSHKSLPADLPFSLSSNRGSANQLTSKTAKVKRKPQKLAGIIYTRQPRVKTSKPATSSQPSHTPFYTWPIGSRGQIVLDEKGYRRVSDLLLRLDFSNETLARESTNRYIDEVSVIAGLEEGQKVWGNIIVGEKDILNASGGRTPSTNALNDGLVRSGNTHGDARSAAASSDRVPNILGDGLVRKRPKLSENEVPAANLLGSNLVRKKPKI